MSRATMGGLVIAIGLAAAPPGLAGAQAPAADPRAALPAVAALFAASALPIGPGSTCFGKLPGVSRLTLGGVLASRFAYLTEGSNRVEGACGPGRTAACRVVVTHAAGEDVASAAFRFRKVAGHLDPASLACILTP